MKRLGCLLSGCLGLGVALAVLVVLTLAFMTQQPPPTAPVLALPVTFTPPPALPVTAATTSDDGEGIVIVTAQTVNNTPGAPAEAHLTATPPAPPGAPFFDSQTSAARQSATVMWTARTAWYAALTQGALEHAATLRALGTPGR